MTVAILPHDDAEAQVWATALEVARRFADLPWVLIGAQMVLLLEREAGRPSGRTTGDVDAVVDVRIVADGTRAAAARLGEHADLTTIPPATTTEIPGGSRALATRRAVEVDIVGVDAGALPVPSLAGAIALKVRAWQARQAVRDVEDLVRLLALVTDVEAVRCELKAPERQALGRVGPLADENHRAWRAVPDPDDAQAAFARLAD